MSQGPAQTCWGALGALGGTASTYSFASEVRLLNSSTSKPLILLLERSLGKEKKHFQPSFSLVLSHLHYQTSEEPLSKLQPESQLEIWCVEGRAFFLAKENTFPKTIKHLLLI